MSRLSPLSLCLLAACADSGATAARGAFEENQSAQGEALVVVGTGIDLQEGLWRVEAGDGGGSLAGSETQVWTPIADLGPGGVLASLGETSFDALPASAPWAVPDRQGAQLLLSVAVPAAGGDRSRVVVLETSSGEPRFGPALVSPRSLVFAASGTAILGLAEPEGGGSGAFVLSVDGLDAATPRWFPVGADARVDGLHADAALDRVAIWGEDDLGFWAESWTFDSDGPGDRVLSWESDTLALGGASLSPEGDLALEVTDLATGRADVVVVPGDGGQSYSFAERGGFEVDCHSPAWSPLPGVWALAATCVHRVSNRPDLGVLTVDGVPVLATAGPQPAVPEGTMDALVVRSRPLWSPDGTTVLFGASTGDAAYLGEGMTLLALPESTGRAYPLVTVTESELDWAHLSDRAGVPSLLLWDRAASAGTSSLRVVPLSGGGEPRPIQPVDSMLLSYPWFLLGDSGI